MSIQKNNILIPTASSNLLEKAKNELKDRSFLFDADEKILYIKWQGQLVEVGGNNFALDEYNLIYNSTNQASLNPNIRVDTATVTPVKDSPSMNSCVDFGKVDFSTSYIKLICKAASNDPGQIGIIGGTLFEKGANVQSSYSFTLSTTGARSLTGASTYPKEAFFVKVTTANDVYYGISFPSKSPSQLLFSGFDTIPEGLKVTGPVDLTGAVIEELVSDDSIIVVSKKFSTNKNAELLDSKTSFTDKDIKYTQDKYRSEGNDTAWNLTTDTNTDIENLKYYNNRDRIFRVGRTISPGSQVPARKGTSENSLDIYDGNFSLSMSIKKYEKLKISAKNLQALSSVMSLQTLDGRVLVSKTQEHVNLVELEYYNSDSELQELLFTSTKPCSVISIEYINVLEDFTIGMPKLPPVPKDGRPHNISLYGDFKDSADFERLPQELRETNSLMNLDLYNVVNPEDSFIEKSFNFKNCDSISSLVLPGNITYIEGSPVKGCTNLKEVILPDTVARVEAPQGFVEYSDVLDIKIDHPTYETTEIHYLEILVDKVLTNEAGEVSSFEVKNGVTGAHYAVGEHVKVGNSYESIISKVESVPESGGPGKEVYTIDPPVPADQGTLIYSFDKIGIQYKSDRLFGDNSLSNSNANLKISVVKSFYDSVDPGIKLWPFSGKSITKSDLKLWPGLADKESILPPEPKKITLKWTNGRNWQNVYVYFFGEGFSGPGWPGTQLVSTETNQYGQDVYATFAPEKATHVIFTNNSGEQTVDILIPPVSTGFYPNGEPQGGKLNVGSWVIEDVSVQSENSLALPTETI